MFKMTEGKSNIGKANDCAVKVVDSDRVYVSLSFSNRRLQCVTAAVRCNI